jgi:murein DD-endopeptidase MepM/ murein hydrolase activator NlpD
MFDKLKVTVKANVKAIMLSVAAAVTAILPVIVPTPAPVSAQTACNTLRPANFTGTVAPSGANVRSTPGGNVIGSLKPNQVVAFDAYTYGPIVADYWTQRPDARSFKLRGMNAFVVSGLINGSPAGSTPLCANSPAPSSNANSPFLPFDPGVSLTIETGYGGHGTAYNNLNRYAVDFGAGGKNVSARASRAGVVTYAGWRNGGFGNVIEIRYNDGKYGNYQHLSQIYVANGATVVGGQGLGKIGSTGNSTGDHLHYMEANSSFGISVPLPQFADAPNANFNNVKSVVTSQNPDNRR